MLREIERRIRAKFREAVREAYGIEAPEPVVSFPPSVELGELSIPSAFELAKKLRQPPREIAQEISKRLLPIEGVERVSVAGGGYLNFYLDRALVASAVFESRARQDLILPSSVEEGNADEVGRGGGGTPPARKILVEHTSINPNKAAHIGHLRNAVLGDTFARLLRSRGENVEVQNYIDNTGLQVADVVVGFAHLEKRPLAEVERLIADPAGRFDYTCWDLYARVSRHYEEDPKSLGLRADALKAIEDGQGELAAIAERVSTAIVRRHLATMLRVGVRYDLLVQESEILKLDFWKSAFELMKKREAIRLEDSGKNRGCWVMSLGETSTGATSSHAEDTGGDQREDVKIIVRSNGTVTYVGKDIAYHLWKFALLGRDFGYEPFQSYPDGAKLWRTAAPNAAAAPPFGHAQAAYAVIDARQSYLQNVVAAALRALGYAEQADNLHHFAYEVVGLTAECAREMGVELEAGESNTVEVSGRKGLGIKADDLIDKLEARALEEVRARELTSDAGEQRKVAHFIAVAALRYFMLKFSRRVIIAFDFKEALAFEGETGPYLQYTVVRAQNIFRKYRETNPHFDPARLSSLVSANELRNFFSGEDGKTFWELAFAAAQMETFVDQAIDAEEPSVLAKFAFRLAQAFNNFYHHHHILTEEDSKRRDCLLFLTQLVSWTLTRTLDLLGIEIPDRM